MTLELCDGDNFDVIPANTGGNFIQQEQITLGKTL